MKLAKIIIYCVLMIALPTSSFASFIVSTHCQTPDNSSHSTHSHTDDTHHSYVNEHMSPDESQSQSECECNCDEKVSCSDTICSAAVLLNTIWINSLNRSSFFFIGEGSCASPPDPNLLFRPPIISS